MNQAQLRAASLLEQYGVVGPPTPDGLVYSLGGRLRVKVHPMAEGLSGLLKRGDNIDIIWLRQQDVEPRRRFTLWHEAGHYLMHNGVAFCMAKTMRQVMIEREADVFATAMLMPEDWLRRDLSEGRRGPGILAQRYAVSFAAMQRRLRELGLAQSLNR